jgi:ankyrin repeat protein
MTILLVGLAKFKWEQLRTAAVSSVEILNMLLDKGLDVTDKDGRGETLLMSAASGGITETVKVLLAHGADVNAKDNAGRTALKYTDHPECSAILSQYGGVG